MRRAATNCGDVSDPGVYRVEDWLKCGEERGWIYSNPIYVP
jgi:hypothetical protein